MTRYAATTNGAMVLIGWLLSGAPLRASDESDFRSLYAQHEPKLYEQYANNRRVKVEVQVFGTLEPSGKLEGRAEYTVVSRGDVFRANSVVKRSDHNWTSHIGGVMWLGNEAYQLSQETPNGYKIIGHYSAATHRNKIEDILYHCKLFLPLSFNGGRRLSEHFATWDRQRTRNHSYEVASVGPATVRGRSAVRVVTRSSDTTTTAYFDPGNHYAFLQYEMSAAPGVLGVGSKAYKMAGELTYADGPDGFPLPKEYTSWFLMPDGRKVPREEVTFTEYEHYAPTDDDFDLEKQFGVKPLPRAGTGKLAAAASLARARSRWLYGAAGILAVATVGLILYRRRRRAAETI